MKAKTTIVGVTITSDDGRKVAEYMFSTHQNRARFDSILRFEALTTGQRKDVLSRYDAYFAS